MNVGLTKTKAEQAFTESFEAIASKLPGSEAVRELRRKAIGTFAALGLPHRRIEEWKYTDLRNLLKEAFAPAIGKAASPSEARTISCSRAAVSTHGSTSSSSAGG